MSKKPEALRLADDLDKWCHTTLDVHKAATELRRLHEVNAELLEALKAIKDHPNTRHEVEAQLGESTWNAIVKAEQAEYEGAGK